MLIWVGTLFRDLIAANSFNRRSTEHVGCRRSLRAGESRVASRLLMAVTIISISLVALTAGCNQLEVPHAGSEDEIRQATLLRVSYPVQNRRKRAPSLQTHTVKASWYGSELRGHKTASGERFDPNRLTAASKTLPMGSVVHVTNPENGRTVTVRINDRGPYVRGRSLDLSHRAARMIGITKRGVARVKVTPVRPHIDSTFASTD